jgi:ferredoxin--NADP+ reductase
MTHHDRDRRVIAVDAPEYNATIVERIDHTDELASFWIMLDGAPVPFKAGQYFTAGIVAEDKIWHRPYTVASPPDVAGSEGYELYVRLVPVVRFTTLLWRLQPGARLQLRGPEGGFTLEPGRLQKHLWVCTGTGIAPFVSMIRQGLLDGISRRAVLVHGVSYASDLSYRKALEEVEQDGSYPLAYVPTVSRPYDPRNVGWSGRTGRVEKIVGDVCDQQDLSAGSTTVSICGNPDMILNVERILMDRRFPEFRVKKELYWPSTPRSEWTMRVHRKDMTGTG